MNRGTVYEALKWLREQGLINFYEKDTKQYFVAEDPENCGELVARQSAELKVADKKLQSVIPELKSALRQRRGKGPRRAILKKEKSEVFWRP